MINFIFLPTDICFFLLSILMVIIFIISLQKLHLRKIWKKIFQSKLAVAAAMILAIFFIIALLDSIHFRQGMVINGNSPIYYSTKVESVLDYLLSPLDKNYETTYSAPFAEHAYLKSYLSRTDNSSNELDYVPLQYVTPVNLLYISWYVFFIVFLIWALIWFSYKLIYDLIKFKKIRFNLKLGGKTAEFSHGFFLGCLFGAMLIIGLLYELSRFYHIFGTTKVGLDVFYEAVKSIRTGVIIGTFTTLFIIPLAIIFGISAGYFGGLIDDIIQYIYTTLSSIPGVLLIAASVLSLQIFISNHPDWFSTVIEQADARLLALCFILGVTSWTGLCRLLRAETLKVREYDFVMAAKSLGVSHFNIIFRHVLPNVFHIIIISIVLDFSGLVLAEAVLSYVGVGVDPSMMSWGNMINSARLELARSPVVWWPLSAAFVFMFTLVLSANMLAERVREAFDPRSL